MNRGFTIIELLVVLAIIGLLVAVAMPSFGLVQRKGRDARRMHDIQTLQKALSLYDVAVGKFPTATVTTTLTGIDAVSLELLNKETIAAIPRDPSAPVRVYAYQSNTIGNTYTIYFCLETDSNPPYTPDCNNTVTP